MSSFFRSVSDSDDSSSDEEEALSDSGDDSGIEGKVTKKTKKAKGSDSDSDSDDSDESDSDADEKKEAAGGVKKSRFLRGGPGSESGESDDERTKVVKSAKSKRIDEVEASVKAIDNAGKINDWFAISNGAFLLLASVSRPAWGARGTDEELHERELREREADVPYRPSPEFDKLVRLISRQATVAEAIPTGFFKALVSLDDMLVSAQAAKKKMNATNAKALNSMKQKLKKTQREHEATIAKYKEVRFSSAARFKERS